MSTDISKIIIQFIDEQILEGEGADLTDDDPLFELGIIDSMTLAKMTAFIQQQFNVEITTDMLLPKHFKDVASISNLIASLAK